MITKTRYVIAVQDLMKSAVYYRDVLGFAIREVGIRTVDGHRIMFGQEIE